MLIGRETQQNSMRRISPTSVPTNLKRIPNWEAWERDFGPTLPAIYLRKKSGVCRLL
jgi:hypothetical protein